MPTTSALTNFGIQNLCFERKWAWLWSRRSRRASATRTAPHLRPPVCHIMCFSTSETVWGRRCYGFQFLPTSSYNQAAAQGNTVPSVGSPFTNLQGVLPNVYFYSPTVDVTKTSTYMCAIRASVPRRGAPCNSPTAPTPSATSVWLLTPCAWVTGCHRYRKLPLPSPCTHCPFTLASGSHHRRAVPPPPHQHRPHNRGGEARLAHSRRL